MSIQASEWRQITGEWKNKIEVNFEGKLRLTMPHPHYRGYTVTRYLHPQLHKGKLVIHLTDINGKRRFVQVRRIVFEAFYGELPEDIHTLSKNGIARDVHINNIAVMTNSQVASVTGKRKANTIVKKTKSHKPIAWYKNSKEAAAVNFVSARTIRRWCKSDKRGFIDDGYLYAYERSE